MTKSWRALRWPIAVCVLLIMVWGIAPARRGVIDLLAPLVRPFAAAGDAIRTPFRLLRLIPSLARDNDLLRAKVNELSAQVTTQAELAHENELLRRELQLKPANAANLIAAQVISRSASVNQQSILINKGQNDGFAEGMAIMSQGYLVGRIAEAHASTSRVTLITSGESLVPAVLQLSRTVGLLKGGTEGLLMQEIPRDVVVTPGEAVVTASLGDAIKGGLPVGTVAAITSGKSDVFQAIKITSPIDISRLELVFGVK